MMSLREQLLHIATLFSTASTTRGREGNATLTSISSRIFNDGKTLARVGDGGDVTTANFERAILWFSDNWPDGLEWPEAILRPSNAAPEAAE